MREAYFAGGCFWCMTPIFKLYEGVSGVKSGYSGGDEENPTYEQVKKQLTGHRESICITYDENQVDYDTLLEVYFANIDPFDKDGQFIDRGLSYTLAVFYQREDEKQKALEKIHQLSEASGKKVYVEVLPFKNFYEAEEEHQDYYLKNPEAFEEELRTSGRKKM